MRIDWNYKKHHRVEIDQDKETVAGAFMSIAHPSSPVAGPEVATFTEEQARQLYEKLGRVLDSVEKGENQ